MSHIRLYSHGTRRVRASVGKPMARPQESTVDTMAGKPELSEAKFLTVAEVAEMMRVSKMTVYRLVHGGDLPAVRVGRSFRVREEDANEYIKNSFYNAGGSAPPEPHARGGALRSHDSDDAGPAPTGSLDSACVRAGG